MVVEVGFSSFKVSDGTEVTLPPAGVTLFVGPNNAGKSQSLRDLRGLAENPKRFVGRAITDVDVRKEGSVHDFTAWVESNVPAIPDANGQLVRPMGNYGSIASGVLPQLWSSNRLANFSDVFIYHADATSRLSAGSSVSNIDFTTQVAAHPLQRAYRNPEIEHQIRDASEEAFGDSLTLDRYAGTVICLRVGVPPDFSHVDGAPDVEYMRRLQELPRLEDQGDGMRSYMGLLIHILAGVHQVTLVDEPEAFLHPPQARLLGRTLSERTTLQTQQLFMATHSVDVVQGAIESDADVTIVRLTRDGDINSAAVLDADEVRLLWSDPLLRYSNLLDGLFHDAVILCEGDADCRFYGSVLDSVYAELGTTKEGAAEEQTSERLRRPQLLFTHCGGKSRMASVTRALRAISVPVVLIADFDVLNDEHTLRGAVEALGGDFDTVREPWFRLDAALKADSKPVGKVALREAVEKAFDEIGTDLVDKGAAERLRSVIRVESGWDKVKRAGISAVPQGSVHDDCKTLVEQLKQMGLLVVPVGELERFVPSISGHGPKWVTSVHEDGHHADPSNTTAREFVRDIVEASGAARP